jgi:hypothetical protein
MGKTESSPGGVPDSLALGKSWVFEVVAGNLSRFDIADSCLEIPSICIDTSKCVARFKDYLPGVLNETSEEEVAMDT